MTRASAAPKLGLPIAIFAAAQFVMVLDSSVMNVSISQIVADLDTTIQGVQLAITAYTLVMAALMLAGAKLGDKGPRIGRHQLLVDDQGHRPVEREVVEGGRRGADERGEAARDQGELKRRRQGGVTHDHNSARLDHGPDPHADWTRSPADQAGGGGSKAES